MSKFSYNKLLKKLVDKDIKNTELKKRQKWVKVYFIKLRKYENITTIISIDCRWSGDM